LILNFQRIINSCEFKEIIVFKDFEIGVGTRYLFKYCLIPKSVNINKTMSKYILFFLIFYLCFLYYTSISEESYLRIKYIHFVIYRLKSIICYYCCYLFINIFFIICIYSEIEFIRPLDDVKNNHMDMVAQYSSTK
jgi:hypothetical protein